MFQIKLQKSRELPIKNSGEVNLPKKKHVMSKNKELRAQNDEDHLFSDPDINEVSPVPHKYSLEQTSS